MQQPHKRDTAFIALGANLARANEALQTTIIQSIDVIARTIGPITRKSRLFRTPCFPAGAGPDYVNVAIALETTLSPQDILSQLHKIEAEFGRVRATRWGSRTLDLDLLAVADRVLPDTKTQTQWRSLSVAEQGKRAPETLILPHPRLQDRAFVLVPMAEIAADWMHPVLGLSVAQMLSQLPAGAVAEVHALV